MLEFSPGIRHYMQLSDFFVGKPGPGSISEAVQQRLPVIVVRNSWTMPQERYNTDWIRDHGLGMVLRSFRMIAPAVQELSGRLDQFAGRVRRIENRAVFEIPRILSGILAGSPQRRCATSRRRRTLRGYRCTSLSAPIPARQQRLAHAHARARIDTLGAA